MKTSAIARDKGPTKAQKWLARFGWFGMPEGAAALAVVLVVPFLIKRISAIRRDSDAFDQSHLADLFSATVKAVAPTDSARAFGVIAPIEVSTIMRGYGPLPAVVGVENQVGDWDAVGQTRTIRLADGTTAREQITAYAAPHHFAYTVSEFSGSLRYLAREARGDWRFADVAEGQTRVMWRYTFRPTSVFAVLPLLLLTHGLWRGYMKQALAECVRLCSE